MPKKKTNYDNKGFVRQLSSRVFSTQRNSAASRRRDRSKAEYKWRPRKNQFERLGGEDEFDLEAIDKAYSFSIESDTGEYKRDLMVQQKKRALLRAKKQGFTGIVIKPSARDEASSRTSSRKKKQRTDSQGFPLSSEASYTSFDDMSRSSKQTNSHNTVVSDPTTFFSRKSYALTKGNLEKLAIGPTDNGIENKNPRSKFYQFSIDEDKESTVVLPVSYPGEADDAENAFDEDVSRASTNYTPAKEATADFEHPNNFFPAENNFVHAKGREENDQRVTSKAPMSKQLSSHRAVSTHSLCYSPSPKYERNHDEDIRQNQMFRTPPSNKRRDGDYARPQTQPRPIRDYRMPLSPLNVSRASNSTSKISFMKNSHFDSWSKFNKDISRDNIFGRTQRQDEQRVDKWKESLEPRRQLYGGSKENKPLNSFDSAESDTSFRPNVQDEMTIGIQSFEGASKGGSAGISIGSYGNILYTHGKSKGTSLSFDDECSTSHTSTSKGSSIESSVGKPMGLPSNAIMASMLFQRHHNIDTRVVEAKLKAKREEKSKMEVNRGDIPRSIQAQDDMYSCISSFSEDTGIEPWKKPTRDLLNYFANSRKTEVDTRRYRREQCAQTTALFEA
jgi:hypothetical protein